MNVGLVHLLSPILIYFSFQIVPTENKSHAFLTFRVDFKQFVHVFFLFTLFKQKPLSQHSAPSAIDHLCSVVVFFTLPLTALQCFNQSSSKKLPASMPQQAVTSLVVNSHFSIAERVSKLDLLEILSVQFKNLQYRLRINSDAMNQVHSSHVTARNLNGSHHPCCLLDSRGLIGLHRGFM